MSFSTSTASETGKEFGNIFNNAFSDGLIQVVSFLWSIFLSLLKAHWLVLMIVLFVAFVATILKAMTGRWGTLGSLLYNSFYFGALFVIGLIWGPEVFINDFWNVAFAVILYPISYYVVGLVLDKIGVRKL